VDRLSVGVQPGIIVRSGVRSAVHVLRRGRDLDMLVRRRRGLSRRGRWSRTWLVLPRGIGRLPVAVKGRKSNLDENPSKSLVRFVRAPLRARTRRFARWRELQDVEHPRSVLRLAHEAIHRAVVVEDSDGHGEQEGAHRRAIVLDQLHGGGERDVCCRAGVLVPVGPGLTFRGAPRVLAPTGNRRIAVVRTKTWRGSRS